MQQTTLSPEDVRAIREYGLTEEAVLAQLAIFRQGIPYTRLQRPCTTGDGIQVLPGGDLERLAGVFTDAVQAGRVGKFVPASGAASRMFQTLLSCLERSEDIAEPLQLPGHNQQDKALHGLGQYMRNLPRFAFYDDLKAVMARDGLDLEALRERGCFRDSLEYLLTPRGLNYAALPKALLKFHRYSEAVRTSLEEHLVEAVTYTRDGQGVARVHFTVTPGFEGIMQEHFEAVRHRYERDGARLDVVFSVQKPSTDTIAVDHDNQPFRDRQGNLVFRPGGHGALLANLYDTAGDIVFIKNIDNIVPDRLKHDTYVYKHALGGYLLEVQNQIASYLRQLGAEASEAALSRMFAFARQRLSIVPPPALARQSRQERAAYLQRMFDRPLRVCGMVPNAGEPGGGPFWVRHVDDALSLQIVETSQVDMTCEEQRAIVAQATHFNPVDLVCGVRDARGARFDLSRFRDLDTGFISHKSHEGLELKALELPGLWNGAMADWNTIFVEVPLSTFNPVKTVFDLLRPQHQS